MQKDRQLPQGQVAAVDAHLGERHRMPKPEGLGGRKLDRQWRLLRKKLIRHDSGGSLRKRFFLANRSDRLFCHLLDVMVERPDRLRLAANRRMRPLGLCPSEDVEMHPALGVGDETP
ncbi:hypothetical protein D9M70_445700 [compost metagenome]